MDVVEGPLSLMARFGSSLCTLGDINADGYEGINYYCLS